MVEAYDRRIRAEASQHLINAQALLAALGVEAGTRVEVGSPARVITRLAAEYDITVVGAHDQYRAANLGTRAGREPRRRGGAGRGLDRPGARRGGQAMEDPGGGQRIARLRTGVGDYVFIAPNQ